MNIGLIARRYATVLYEYSIDKNMADSVYSDSRMLQSQFKENKSFVQFLSSPLKKQSEKRAFMQTVFSGNVCEAMSAFLLFVVDKGRGEILNEILRVFDNMYRKNNGIYGVCISTAVELPEEKVSGYAAMIGKKLNCKVDITAKCDPSLIGGMVITIDDKQLDGSIAHRLKEIEKQLTA